MLVTIRQTEASGRNLFEVVADDRVIYRAETPWAALSLPFDAENLRKLVFSDAEGNDIFHTDYNLVENLIQSATELKSLFGKSTRVAEYMIVDRDNVQRGSFYARIDGVATSQYVISYDGRIYDCYSIALGKIYVVSVYDGDRQIAQLTKPLDTWNQLDIYYLHLVDEYSALLPILSFFIIYLDACKFDRSGKYVKYSFEKVRAYSFNKNNGKYNADWIADTFGQDEAAHLNSLLERKYGKGTARLSKPAKHALIALVTAAVIILAGIVGFAIYITATPKIAINADEFTRILTEQGCDVTPLDSTGDYTSIASVSDELYIQFIAFDSNASAQAFYDSTRGAYESGISGGHSEYSSSRANSDKYTLISGGNCYVVSRIDNTVVLCTSPESDKDRLDKLMSLLGY